MANTNEEGIPNELQQLIRGLWEKTQSDANEKIKTHQLEADAQISEAKNNVALTQQQNALLHAEIKTLSEKLTKQTNNAEALKNTINQSENEKAKLIERISSLESHNSDHKNENDRLHILLKNTQNNLTHYQQAIEQQRQEQALLFEKQRVEFELKLSQLQNQLMFISQEKIKIETQYNEIKNSHERFLHSSQKIQTEYHDLKINYQQLLMSHAQELKSHQQLLQQNEIQKNDINTKNKEISEIKIAYAISENQLKIISKQLQHTEDQLSDLKNQYQFTLSDKIRLENQLQHIQNKEVV